MSRSNGKKGRGEERPCACCFAEEEKQRILDEYVEVISDIGLLNSYSKFWLCHPVSEKNDLIPNNLFSQLTKFMVFHKLFSEKQEDNFAILTSDSSLIRNVIVFSVISKIDYTVIDKVDINRCLGAKWKLSAYKLHDFSNFRRKLKEHRKMRSVSKMYDKRKTYTVIRTWFDKRSANLIDQGMDPYWGKLPKVLKSEGKEVLFWGGIINPEDDQIHYRLQSVSLDPIIVSDSLLNIYDYLKAFVFRFMVRYRVTFPERISINNIDVTFVFKNYFNSQLKGISVISNYLSYLAVKKLLEIVKVDQFFNLFENYAWEKLTTIAVREKSGNIILKAFQHAQVAIGSTKFFLGKEEARLSPWPDKLITLGRITRDFLVQNKNYPTDITVCGCALRHDYQIPDQRVRTKGRNRILVFGWTFERSIEMLNFLNSSKIADEKKYAVRFCPHPVYPFHKLLPYIDFEYDGSFKVSTESLEDDFKNADIVVYTGTTICLDSLAAGLPVVNVEFDSFLSQDPLFCFCDFKWTVNKPNELTFALESINNLTDDEYYVRQGKAFEFIKKYFYPINDQNLESFLS